MMTWGGFKNRSKTKEGGLRGIEFGTIAYGIVPNFVLIVITIVLFVISMPLFKRLLRSYCRKR
jgi:hypothetical protein